MPNIFSDIKTAVKLTGAVRKVRKAGASGVQVKPVYTVPVINTGYWVWTMESCLFYHEQWRTIKEAFKGLP